MEVIAREQDGSPLYFVCNFTAENPTVELDGSMTDCLTGETLCGRAEVPMTSFRVLRPAADGEEGRKYENRPV